MDEGWLKLYRELIQKPIWKLSTPEQKSILITILCMVNHETQVWEWKGKKYKCAPGQKITSLKKIAEECGKGISIQNVRTALVRFEKLQFLTSESTNESRLITVLNWGLYQSTTNELTKQLTGGSQRGNKQLTTNKNVRMKEIEVEEGQTSESDIFKFFNENINPISPHQAEVISNAIDLDDLAPDLILEILKDSLGKRDRWSWIKRVIDNCYRSGVKTLEQYNSQKVEKAQVKSRDAPKQTKTVSFADLAKEMQANDNAGNSSYYDDS